ncbi:DUF86 domain-containing protein [Bacillus sp. B1-b2]|uniref:DUF86 domain-containing protein n=1 Tax=Bacillus sp. B1-b2 TaxID=2653201 RepID=UPI00126225E1|nr:DUF86 domain-containing protein [Bacillus sp. B1-b2]KAB7666489.1 DUF86 domain-containing protein [Bacillus sp. B1-b2]
MYFVDRLKLEEQLHYLNNLILLFEKKTEWRTEIEKLSLERITHMIIEVILDIGNSMIDGFIMRDPGSYEDIIDILTDEKVINDEVAHDLKEIILWRKSLVHEYTAINHLELQRVFKDKISSIKEFNPSVSGYLLNELGPVSAFKN